MVISEYLIHIMVAVLAYSVGVASPGPATIAIMQVSASQGRSQGLRFSAGVIVGSSIWGNLAVFGLATVMEAFAWGFIALKIVGGFYLLWLAYKMFRSSRLDQVQEVELSSGKNYFLQGLLLHLTNPKAVFVWTAIISLGLPQGAPVWVGGVIFAGCIISGIGIFTGYALVFSTRFASVTYGRARRRIESVVSALYALAGFKLLLSKN